MKVRRGESEKLSQAYCGIAPDILLSILFLAELADRIVSRLPKNSRKICL